MGKYTLGIAGADFDFPKYPSHLDDTVTLDTLAELKNLMEFMPNAESATISLTPLLISKDASRVRIEIVYKKEYEEKA